MITEQKITRYVNTPTKTKAGEKTKQKTLELMLDLITLSRYEAKKRVGREYQDRKRKEYNDRKYRQYAEGRGLNL